MAEPTLTAEVVADPDGFLQLASEWDELVDRSAQRTCFLRWHWNWLWWTHFAPPAARLQLICCRDRFGRLVGLAPLYVAARSLLAAIPMRELHFLGTGTPTRINEYMDVIARCGHEAAVARSVAHALASRREWDCVCLHGVPDGESVSKHVVRALGVGFTETVCDRAPFVDTSQGWDAFKATLGKSMRRNVEYYPRRLFQQHTCAFGRVDTGCLVDEALDDLMRLHQARWQAAGQPGSFSNPAVVAFLRAASHAAAQNGRLRLWRLSVDDAVQAALIGFVEGDTVHYFQTGFNPAMPKADLGTVVLALAIKDCCEDPAIRIFDFMGGVGYKAMWARQQRVMLHHEARRPSLRTGADGAWKSARQAAARVYHAVRLKSER